MPRAATPASSPRWCQLTEVGPDRRLVVVVQSTSPADFDAPVEPGTAASGDYSDIVSTIIAPSGTWPPPAHDGHHPMSGSDLASMANSSSCFPARCAPTWGHGQADLVPRGAAPVGRQVGPPTQHGDQGM